MSVSYGLFKSRFKKTIADSIYNEVVAKTARYYHFLGKENAWTDFLSPFIPSQDPTVGDVPGAPSDNFRYELHVRRDILTTKLISSSDLSYVVPRVDWEYGVVYDMYDDAISADDPAPSGAVRLEDARFYVLTSEYNVYKCISNNNRSKSTIEPTGAPITTFTTSDGYVWKFMYTIPIALRNRFLSSAYMPVTTALKAQFYSNGEIIQVTVEDGGSGYLNPQLIVSGDGYLKDNPYAISGITITNPGKGYLSEPTITFTNPTVISGSEYTATGSVTIDAEGSVNSATLLTAGYGYTADPIDPVITVSEPIIGALPFEISTNYNNNDTVKYDGNYYIVVGNGTSGLTHPTHTVGMEANGSIQLTYIATQAILSPDMVKTEADMDAILGPGGEIIGVTINNGGTGYTNANIQVIDTSGDPHSYFENSDWIAGGGSVWFDDTSMVPAPGNKIRISTNGENQLAANLRIAKVGDILNITTMETGAHTLTLTSEFTETYAYGFVAEVDQTSSSSAPGGWENFTGTIEIVPGPLNLGGSGAVIVPNFNVGNVDTLQANVELLATPGTIDAMAVVNGGVGYGAATVTVLGDGVGCTAEAQVTGGKVTSIVITNPGQGYTWTDVVIDGNGTGAVVRAIMAPLGGHGYNAIDELNASSIMFYSSFSRDVNQGLNVTNDYRKAGLLKNIREFGSTNRFKDDVGSGCVLITGTFDKTKLAYDQLLVQTNAPYKKYRIVEFNDTQILVSVFNNFTINVGDSLSTPEGYSIKVTDVKERTIDQFSGDFLFLTVREPFAPSEEQIITIRTVLTI